MKNEFLRNHMQACILMIACLFGLSAVQAQNSSSQIASFPLEISVIPAATNAPGVGGVLVKTGTPLKFILSDTSPRQMSLKSDPIIWSARQLKGDGSFTDWQALAVCNGSECTYTPESGGIFQLKATLTLNGQTLDIPWLRKQDAGDSIDGDGNCSVAGKKDAPEYFGIVDTQTQIALRNKAHEQIGTTNYSKGASLTVPTSSLLGSYTITPGHDKCNAFIYVTANSVGASVPLTRRNKLFLTVNPPLAFDWYDGTYPIEGWKALSLKDYPQAGYVVARPDASVWDKNDPMYGWNHGQRYAHVGILDYDGSWIQADEKKVDEYPHLTDPKYQPVGMRQYMGN